LPTCQLKSKKTSRPILFSYSELQRFHGMAGRCRTNDVHGGIGARDGLTTSRSQSVVAHRTFDTTGNAAFSAGAHPERVEFGHGALTRAAPVRLEFVDG
jgi:hypothetical protein